MSLPVLVAVDDDPDLLRDVERELLNRYVPDYRVCCLSSADEALERLEELSATGEDVALVLAGEQLAGAAGTALLAEGRRLFPHALRVLLARRAYEQAWVFGAGFAFMHRATDLRREHDGMVVSLDNGGVVVGRAVVLATGASYRRLGGAALEELHGAGVFYGAAASAAPLVSGEDVYVVGGANSAGQAALHLARYARRVTLVVRATTLDAGMSHYLVRRIEETPDIDVRTGTEVVDGGGDD
jgi:thioredoxin reductase